MLSVGDGLGENSHAIEVIWANDCRRERAGTVNESFYRGLEVAISIQKPRERIERNFGFIISGDGPSIF